MKLIVKDYLRSLKERDELDRILCDLLSIMGLTVITIPQRGSTQYGVDISAVGRGPGDKEDTVYLLSIKQGDLGRNEWDAGGSSQALRPSLDEILDVYLSCAIPSEHKEKPIRICICLGGVIKETVRLAVTQYKKKKEREHKRDNVSFCEWNGDALAEMICGAFLDSKLLIGDGEKWFRKSLAMVEEPETSYLFFKKLIIGLFSTPVKDKRDKIRVLQQANLCLGILFSWCRDAGNLESAYLSAELTLLYMWEFLIRKPGVCEDHNDFLMGILRLYIPISSAYVQKIALFATEDFHLSYAVRMSTDVDVNLHLFDVIGRLAVIGLTVSHVCFLCKEKMSKEDYMGYSQYCDDLRVVLVRILRHNPILHIPYKDGFATEISLASLFLYGGGRKGDVEIWLVNILKNCRDSLFFNTRYPACGLSYEGLLDHPHDRTDKEYRERVLAASELYPTLALIGTVIDSNKVWAEVQGIERKYLLKTNLQLWFPNEQTEEFFYRNSGVHGVQLCSLSLRDREVFEEIISLECEKHNLISMVSVVKDGFSPIFYMGVRHYHLPLPVCFWWSIYKEENEAVGSSENNQ